MRMSQYGNILEIGLKSRSPMDILTWKYYINDFLTNFLKKWWGDFSNN
jgi:hypothetical protein